MPSHHQDPALIEEVGAISTATLHEAMGKTGALPAAIKPLHQNMRLCGTAFTVHTMPGDNLLLHRAMAKASAGDVLVVNVSNHYEAGYWGEIMTVAALQRGIAGLVVDGCVRDAQAIEELAFPLFSRGLCIRGTTKYGNGTLNQSIVIGDTKIRPGDIIVGDRDGVVVVPIDRLETTVEAAKKREQKEAATMTELRNGKTTLEIYGWE
jgi:4-hydroxy-4-methyl-2-oxoglutarate aldolase